MDEKNTLSIISSTELNLLIYLAAIIEKKKFPGIECNVDQKVYQEIKKKITDTWNQIITESKQFNSIGRYDEIINSIFGSVPQEKRDEISHYFRAWWFEQPQNGFGYIMEKLVFQLPRKELERVIGNEHSTIVLVFDAIPESCQQQNEKYFIIIPLYRFCPI
ncbi:hypothetical protein [Sporosarcina sp. OR05]|uniref:hypothetical protein n=1 Tax=Sporosarcina sp. OR05 TaxID=2969819 RepID=UPI00352A6A25